MVDAGGESQLEDSFDLFVGDFIFVLVLVEFIEMYEDECTTFFHIASRRFCIPSQNGVKSWRCPSAKKPRSSSLTKNSAGLLLLDGGFCTGGEEALE